MNKWEVYRCEFPHGRRQWCAMNRGDYWSDRYFDTHTEAIAYADQRARTLEVVVPPGMKVSSAVRVTTRGAFAEIGTHDENASTTVNFDELWTILEDHAAALVVLARGLKEEE